MNNVVIKNRISKGIIKRDYLDFDYTKQPLTNSEELDTWRSQGYYHKSFLGSMFNGKNPMPEWIDEIPEALIKKINVPNNFSAKSESHFSNGINSFSTKNKQTSNNQYDIKIGAMVKHDKFGSGMVTGYEGNENDLRIQIKFKAHGVKWLAMEYAKLTKI